MVPLVGNWHEARSKSAAVGNGSGDRSRIGELLRERSIPVVDRWKALMRGESGARDLKDPSLVDRLPDFLAGMARAITTESEDRDEALKSGAAAHAVQRLELGYDASELAREYMHLRTALYDELHGAWPNMPVEAWRPIDLAIDRAVTDVIRRLNEARDKKLRALERISKETISAPDMSALVDHLVDGFSKVAPDVDVAIIFIREGNALQKRAVRGLEDPARRDLSVGIGEGFTGMIAASREPMFVRDARTDPLVGSDFLHGYVVRALYGVPLVHEDEVVGVAHVGSTKSHDFPREDRLLASAFAERAAALIAARKRTDAMQETARLRDLFLGMLGHDLRSPLHAISGCAELLLRRDIQDPAQRRVLLRILGSVERMDRLVGDILDFARTRLGGGIPITLDRVDLTELCQTAVAESELARPGRVRFTSALREAVACDPQRLSQVISNLLANAVEHAPEPSTVDVRLFAAGGDIVMVVYNEGSISPELLPYLFEPFRRGDRRRVGLGLYITREIVVAHHGSIEVRSPGQNGTTVTVRIPREAAAAAAQATPADPR